MQVKDYYHILRVPVNSSENEIRKAFRKLALEFHPDKTNGDKFKEAIFREVQEAYHILSDRRRREEYNYQRWYTRNLGKGFREVAITPALVLSQTTRLSEYVLASNDLQIDHDLLSSRIRSIISDERIEILLQFDDKTINHRIIKLMMRVSRPLPLEYLDPVLAILWKLAQEDGEMEKELNQFRREQISNDYWNRRSGWIALGIALLFCWLMYLFAR